MPFIVSVGAWWEWFLTTITNVEPTEFIAVGNRSHNQPNPIPGTQIVSFSINLAVFLASGPALVKLHLSGTVNHAEDVIFDPNIEPQNSEGWFSLCSVFAIKSTGYLPSTFDIHYSIFAFLSFFYRSNWAPSTRRVNFGRQRSAETLNLEL